MSGRDELLGQLQKHADSRGRISVSVDRLRILVGLDIHDVSKELFALEQAGLVELRTRRRGDTNMILGIKLRRGALNTAALATEKMQAHSVPERAWAWLEGQPTIGGWVNASPGDIAAGIGLERGDSRVAVAVSGWARQGRIALRKEKQRIVAIKLGPGAQPAPVKPQAEPVPPPAPEAVAEPPTPELEKYARARAIAQISPEGNPYLRVEFEPHPLGEEGLQLRKALRAALGRKEGETDDRRR